MPNHLARASIRSDSSLSLSPDCVDRGEGMCSLSHFGRRREAIIPGSGQFTLLETVLIIF